VVITARKALDEVERERRPKRGGGDVRGESAWGEARGIEQIVGKEPTPAFAAQMAEETQRLLELLPDPSLRSIAIWKMEGYSNEEIAAKLGCVTRTVARRLTLIRTLWREQRDESTPEQR
jgi:DNA-directed RNA polymerase specialized sigma24 family protein